MAIKLTRIKAPTCSSLLPNKQRPLGSSSNPARVEHLLRQLPYFKNIPREKEVITTSHQLLQQIFDPTTKKKNVLIVLNFNLVSCQLVDVSVNVESLSGSLLLTIAQKRTVGQAAVPQHHDEVCKVDSEITVVKD